MGYFSELQISWMERQEQLFSHSMPADDSYLAPVLQMRGKLNELKTQLQDYIFWDNLYSFQKGRALRDWKKVYAKWPSYWDDPRSELKDYPSIFFSYSYNDYDTVDKILVAIAGTQKMLYLYGYNADAEEEKKRPAVSHIQPLEGQTSMLSAS